MAKWEAAGNGLTRGDWAAGFGAPGSRLEGPVIIGVPREIMDGERRVALTPAGAETLVRAGHRVIVEVGAGLGSGFADDEYRRAGAAVLAHRDELYAQADLVVKVKQPLPEEYHLLRAGLIVFAYLHLAADPELAHQLCAADCAALAYETVQLADGTLPLLEPMSEIAGKVAVQVAAHLLEARQGGIGKLLGGATGVAPCRVVVIGGGTAGAAAARVALGMGAQVTVLDVTARRLHYLGDVLRGNLITLTSNPASLASAVTDADVVIGSVLVPGARAPRLVDRELVRRMTPGGVVIDIAIDQGGCIETSRVTSQSEPVHITEGAIHYGVPNMPSVVARTATQALSNATLPYIAKLAELGLARSLSDDEPLRKGLNVFHGTVTHEAVAAALGPQSAPPVSPLAST